MTYAVLMQLKPHICMTYAVHMPVYALRRRRLEDHAGKGSEDSFGAVGRDECRGSILQAARRRHHQKRQERLRGMILTPEAADASERNVQLESERLRTLSVSASRQGLSVIGPSVQGDRKKTGRGQCPRRCSLGRGPVAGVVPCLARSLLLLPLQLSVVLLGCLCHRCHLRCLRRRGQKTDPFRVSTDRVNR